MKRWDEAQKHLAANDTVLARLIKQYGDCTLTPHTDYYAELVSSIISQQLSEKAAATIYRRFLELFNDKLPTPEQIIETDAETIRKVGCSYGKISYMKDLAEHIVDGRLDLENVATMPDDEVIKQLVAVRGIGEWTAHMFMIFSLGRTQILPNTDLGIRKSIMLQYGLKELPTANIMLQISLRNHWNPYESIASWYLWKSLDNR